MADLGNIGQHYLSVPTNNRAPILATVFPELGSSYTAVLINYWIPRGFAPFPDVGNVAPATNTYGNPLSANTFSGEAKAAVTNYGANTVFDLLTHAGLFAPHNTAVVRTRHAAGLFSNSKPTTAVSALLIEGTPDTKVTVIKEGTFAYYAMTDATGKLTIYDMDDGLWQVREVGTTSAAWNIKVTGAVALVTKLAGGGGLTYPTIPIGSRILILKEGKFVAITPKFTPPVIEEEPMYAKRVDTVGDTLIYIGEAAVGTANDAPVWRIRRITLVDNDITEEWANGVDLFDKIWNDHLTLGYS